MNLKCEGYCALHLKFFQNLICCKADKPAVSGESFVSKVTTFCKYAISRGEIYIFLLQMSCFPCYTLLWKTVFGRIYPPGFRTKRQREMSAMRSAETKKR